MMQQLSEVLATKESQIHRVSPSTTVAAAVRQMKQSGIGALLVTEADRLVGIFTERDVLLRIVDEERDPKTTVVSEVMTPDPLCVSTFTTVETAMHVINERRIRRLPVVDNDCLVGVVSIGDLTRWLVRAHKVQLDHVVRAVERVTLSG
jgi:CBS domain-containing protein